MSTPKVLNTIKFGPFSVAKQVFHQSASKLSYGLVNIKPLLPGHVLVCPTRCVPRVSLLSSEETVDLFLSVKRISQAIERVFKATSLNIAIQDGVDAGQSVPHVHVHIIPRQPDDLKSQGGSDAIYGMMDGDPGNVGQAFQIMQEARAKRENHRNFVAGPDSDRAPRSEEEMNEEAEWLRQEMEKDDAR